jgi:hypothetical protein
MQIHSLVINLTSILLAVIVAQDSIQSHNYKTAINLIGLSYNINFCASTSFNDKKTSDTRVIHVLH